ncbi:DUF3667 domain-containing protein [Kordia zhangzhouensis]|uniref:DUF3667 domain-containing protein n=1 Tax=Kordia zhangzhouensis TaxID=1620405 RepID=UPI0006294BA7|nr:DUF3667 domain-containing protein [Kordia zhangzhouensis]
MNPHLLYCKNCNTTLQETDQFCANCGAKIIRNRLTLKNLWQDFSERFLNYDNVFFKTIRHMFTQPEEVIESYIQGTRKKYLHVFNYFAISLTITGFLTFIFLKFYPNIFTDAMDVFNSSQQSEAQKQLFSNFMSGFVDFQSLIYLLIIPLLALISKIVFYNYKQYNYTEHTIIYLYAYSHTVVLLNLMYLVCIIVYAPLLQYFVLLSIPLSTIYVGYVLKRLFRLNLKQILIKSLLFIVIGSIFYIIIVFIIGILIVLSMLVDGSFIEMIEQQKMNGN